MAASKSEQHPEDCFTPQSRLTEQTFQFRFVGRSGLKSLVFVMPMRASFM